MLLSDAVLSDAVLCDATLQCCSMLLCDAALRCCSAMLLCDAALLADDVRSLLEELSVVWLLYHVSHRYAANVKMLQ